MSSQLPSSSTASSSSSSSSSKSAFPATEASPLLPAIQNADTTTTIEQPRSRDHVGIPLLLLSQLLISIMNLIARYLSTSLDPPGRKFHTFQILFIRMGSTLVLSLAWMAVWRVEHAPLGPKGAGVRRLLVGRGVGSFIAVAGLYYSLAYLPLPTATLITFLVPTFVSLFASLHPQLREPFTTPEKLAGLVSLLGVVLITQPNLFKQQHEHTTPSTTLTPAAVQRVLAVLVGLLGVLGISSTYTFIRLIGTRVHPLISVAYFAAITTGLSFIGLFFTNSGWVQPHGFHEWGLLLGIGLVGFVQQFLLTWGLQMVKAGRAGGMVYTQLVWALVFEWIVWGGKPGVVDCVGGVLILGGSLAVALWKGRADKGKDVERDGMAGNQESR